MQIKNSGQGFKVVGEDDAREPFVILIDDCEKLEMRWSSAELALN